MTTKKARLGVRLPSRAHTLGLTMNLTTTAPENQVISNQITCTCSCTQVNRFRLVSVPGLWRLECGRCRKHRGFEPVSKEGGRS